MIYNILPIGTLIELEDGKKLIILGYKKENNIISYICGQYPVNYLIDLVPEKKVKEFIDKYKYFNTDCIIPIESKYNVIQMGYKDETFDNFINKLNY